MYKSILMLALFMGAMLSSCQAEKSANDALLMDVLRASEERQWTARHRVDSLACYFLGSPYVAATLESEDGEESLVINLRELDCMTFVENVLALNRLLQEKEEKDWHHQACLRRFPEILEEIRYRQGKRQDYTSRLHYTSEWILDNAQKGYVQDITSRYSDALYEVNLNFMSTHPHLYKALTLHPEWQATMAQIEQSINGTIYRYIPKEELHRYENEIPSGCIVAILGTTPGLDFAHLGFTYRKDGCLHLLHASSSGKKVMLSSGSLSDYLSDIKRFKGIVLLEVL